MAMLGKRRPSRAASGKSGLTRKPTAKSTFAVEQSDALVIERLAHDGRGVSHDAAGKTVFIDRALPGERVEVAVHVNRKRFDEAHVKTLLDRSAQRVEPPCGYFGQCGGCQLQHMNIDAQRAHKQEVLRELFVRQGLHLDTIGLLAGSTEHYRRRARLGVKVDGQGSVLLGFRAAHSHRLVDIEQCHVLVPPLQRLLPLLRAFITTLEAPKLVGHIELLATDSESVLLVRQLKEHAGDAKRWQAFAERLSICLGAWVGRETAELHWYSAAPVLQETLRIEGQAPLALTFAPGDFLQVNAEVNQLMVARVVEWLAPEPGQHVLDLFAGMGNFSLPLASKGARVHAVEGSSSMVARIKTNATRNQVEVSAQQADLSDNDTVKALLNVKAPFDALVLDPPRNGAEIVCQTLGRYPVPRLAYVSCDPATLARDAAHLVNAGYRIKQVAVADMFLHTAHMETLMLFEYEG
ncbi:23S rRNA (uracil(1939)-C(5))-methyltransferase RlmD [Vreelandella nanhaiensis]|uniref:23S rRNA (uracil(1939)-C(5))-methyltransferase RlmD n=1 Tax=Vreelandella nanhaiensis TaxID=1258546 RepID=A0A433KPU4_9GAMM|nr:23S rRNA (uracil(1939)-C(5))-methyltransferase RlmD [Halomonas nanhaiensis]RUR31626.1 23S rRNA (uracil(1939)-C(5))-methyltransferase RlmD [Halomonas nanhaiensis]